MSTTANAQLRCLICGQYYPLGTVHFCPTYTPPTYLPEKVALAIDMLGATELGNTAWAVLDYIAKLENDLVDARRDTERANARYTWLKRWLRGEIEPEPRLPEGWVVSDSEEFDKIVNLAAAARATKEPT